MIIKDLCFIIIFLIEILFIFDLAGTNYDVFAILILCKILNFVIAYLF